LGGGGGEKEFRGLGSGEKGGAVFFTTYIKGKKKPSGLLLAWTI